MSDKTQIFIAAVTMLCIILATWKANKKCAGLRDYIHAVLYALWAVLLSNILF
jgi:hypothetical protein